MGKKLKMADDMLKYNICMMGVQETHTTECDVELIKTTDGRKSFILHTSGRQGTSRTGVGIVVRPGMNTSFTAVSDRLCMCKLILEESNRAIYMICAYAPTLPVSEKNPDIRDKFYEDLESLIRTVSNRSIILVTVILTLRQAQDTTPTDRTWAPSAKGCSTQMDQSC